MSHVTGAAVESMDLAIHRMAMKVHMLPWVLEEMDPPADKFLRAVEIENADARGRAKAAERQAEQRQKAPGRRR